MADLHHTFVVTLTMRRIAELRLKEGWTQKMIAEELGLSQMHVSRLQNEAMKKLGEFCFADKLSA